MYILTKENTHYSAKTYNKIESVLMKLFKLCSLHFLCHQKIKERKVFAVQVMFVIYKEMYIENHINQHYIKTSISFLFKNIEILILSLKVVGVYRFEMKTIQKISLFKKP